MFNREYIDEGDFGVVFKVQYSVGEADPEHGKSGTRTFALKRYKNDERVTGDGFYIPPSAKRYAEKSAENYSQLRELGIPTWTTYRLSQDHQSVLMSLKGATEDSYLIFPNHKESTEVEDNRKDYVRLKNEGGVNSIENLESVVERWISVYLNLNVGVNFNRQDVIGIVYNRDTNTIEVLAGDLDNVRIDKYASISDGFQRQNLYNLKFYVLDELKGFIMKYMTDDNPKKIEYVNYLDGRIKEVLEKSKTLPKT